MVRILQSRLFRQQSAIWPAFCYLAVILCYLAGSLVYLASSPITLASSLVYLAGNLSTWPAVKFPSQPVLIKSLKTCQGYLDGPSKLKFLFGGIPIQSPICGNRPKILIIASLLTRYQVK